MMRRWITSFHLVEIYGLRTRSVVQRERREFSFSHQHNKSYSGLGIGPSFPPALLWLLCRRKQKPARVTWRPKIARHVSVVSASCDAQTTVLPPCRLSYLLERFLDRVLRGFPRPAPPSGLDLVGLPGQSDVVHRPPALFVCHLCHVGMEIQILRFVDRLVQSFVVTFMSVSDQNRGDCAGFRSFRGL